MTTTKKPRAAGSAQHTPGPWRITPNSSGYELEIKGPPRAWPRKRGLCRCCDSEIVASIRPFVGSYAHYPAAIAEKNAHLIAAAPDLLAALQSLLAVTPEDRLGVGTFERKAYSPRNTAADAARAAIAKAEGSK